MVVRFGVGDTVLYGTQGVCRIERTEKQRVRGNDIEYYVLCPVYNENSTVFVPMQNDALVSKMRSILSAEDIYEMIRSMPEEDTIWIDDENQRKLSYQQLINEGDRKKLVQLIKTLYLHKLSQEKKGRKLHQSDESMLKQAEKLLYDEFALVLNIQPEEVLPFIMEQVEITKK
ncbi:MAG: CarD family transcriptional regulator [Clostridia bacterium]|nr:CarD family transcriptional regulator [Clostridia bacterium]